MEKKSTKVIVIGTGISGLYCGYLLKKSGVDVAMLEAADWVGGRMKHLKGWIDWKTVDLGAEFIHGKKSILNDIINENGWPNRVVFTWAQGDGEHPKDLIGKEYAMYYLGKEKKLLRYDTDHPEITKVNSLLFGLSDLEVSSGDRRSLEQYLRENGVSDLGLALADAGYSNSLCAVSSKMSLYETVEINKEWNRFGEGDYRLDNSTIELINFLSKGLDIRLNWVVKSIDYNDPIVTITNQMGEKMFCEHVVVTVPLMVLKENSIHFSPTLPKQKLDAINNLAVDNAIKIVLTFSKQFWPSRLNGVICADTLIPELWFENYDRVGQLTPYSNQTQLQSKLAQPRNSSQETKTETFVVSAFATSKFADTITSLKEDELIKRILQQLDDMFGYNQGYKLFNETEAEGSQSTYVANPASKYFIDYKYQDWSKEPFVKGGYSHPSLTSSQQIREQLASPLNNRIFWAGEATHPKAYMTMHGAIETGHFAANHILDQLILNSNNNQKSKSNTTTTTNKLVSKL